jgi:outer membrane protein assembly factor BamB
MSDMFDIDGIARREDLEERRRSIVKRRRIIWLSVLGVIFLFILFLVLYHFTNIMFGVSQDLESAPQNGDWAMFRRDQAHTGSTGDSDSSINGTLKWTFTTGSAIHSSPAVVNGVVYFGSRDHYIYALDEKTGKQLWSFQTGSWVESSPVVVDGVLYCGSNDGYLYALDAATGVEKWRFRVRYGLRSSPAVANGRVYIGSDDYHLYAVDADTGKGLWNLETGNIVISSPVVTEGVVLVGSMDGSCYALNAANGRHRLEFKSSSPITASPAVDNGIAYFTNASGSIYAIDATARNWLLENRLIVYWRVLYLYGVAPKPPPPSGFIWSTFYPARVGSSPAVADGALYVGLDNSLVSFNLSDSRVKWRFTASDWILSSPAVTQSTVYFGSNDGHLYAVDRATGVKRWDYLTGNSVSSSPAVADGMVFVGSEDGKFYAFD